MIAPRFASLGLAALGFISTLVNGCAKKASGPAMMPPVPVLASKAISRTVPYQISEIGTVEAFETVSIKSRIEGHLLAIHFKEGDFVARGQLLFSLDPRPPAAAVAQAEANLKRDEAQARQAQADERRYFYLWSERVGSRQQYDQAQTSAGTSAATVAADRAMVDSARLNLQYTEIRSPIDGRTGNLQAHLGDLIKPDADTPLVTIAQIQPIYVAFSIPERELAAVRDAMERQPLEVNAVIPNPIASTIDSAEADAAGSPAQPNSSVSSSFAPNPQEPSEHGMLSFIDNTVDRTTGTILLKGLFQNEQRRLWPGTFVNVNLTISEIRNAIMVPSAAVQVGQQGAFVFVVGADHKAAIRPVVPGFQLGGETLIERGLAPGEMVVTDGQLRLAPGAMVSVKEAL